MESIKGKMQARSGQVVFLCGRELMAKFEEYYPEFLLFSSELYGSYIAELERGLDTDPAVMNVLSRHGFLSGPKNLTSLYVRPKFTRDLHQFTLNLISPERMDLLSPLTSDESDILQKWFRELGRLAVAITMPEDTGALLQESLEELAQDVKVGWKEADDVHRRRTDISTEERNKPRNEVRIEISSAKILDSTAKQLLKCAIDLVDKLKDKLASANSCAESHFPNVGSMLQSPWLLDYCKVEGISTQVPRVVQMSDVADQKYVFDEQDIDATVSNVLITGPAGFGKTSFCKWLTLRDLKRYRNGEANIVPVYVPLYQHAQGELRSFETAFLRAPEFIAIWERKKGFEGTSSPRFRLYLDGLDEVPSFDRQKELLGLAMRGKEEDPRTSIMVTGRDHVWGVHLDRFVRIRVREFDEGQIQELASKWFEEDEHSVAEFFTQLDKVCTLGPLMRFHYLPLSSLGSTKIRKRSRSHVQNFMTCL